MLPYFCSGLKRRQPPTAETALRSYSQSFETDSVFCLKILEIKGRTSNNTPHFIMSRITYDFDVSQPVKIADRKAASAKLPRTAKTGFEANHFENRLELHLAPEPTVSIDRTESTDSLIQQSWSTFSRLDNSQRELMLKGILARCSPKQTQFISTLLKLKSFESVKVADQFTIPKFDSRNNDSEKKVKPKFDAKINNSDIKKHVGSLNTNIYLKLFNGKIDPETLAKQAAMAGPENAKFLIQLLAARCSKFQRVAEIVTKLTKEIEESASEQIFFDCILDSADAMYGSIYLATKMPGKLKLLKSNWPTDRTDISTSKIYGYQRVICAQTCNACNVKSSDDFKDVGDYYDELQPACILAIPVYGEDLRVVGIIELVNKSSGNPFFNEQDLAIVSFLASILSLKLFQIHGGSKGNRKQESIQKNFFESTKGITSETDVGDLISAVIKTARDILSAERCSIFLVDEENGQLWSRVAQGSLVEIRLPLGQGISGHVATTGEVLNISDPYNDPRFNRTFDSKNGFKTRNILCTPMRDSAGKIIGVIQAINKLPLGDTFSSGDAIEILSFCSVVASTIQTSLDYHALKKEMFGVMMARVALSSMLQAVPNMLLGLNSSGKVTYINNTKLFNMGDFVSLLAHTSYQNWLGADNYQLQEDITSALAGNFSSIVRKNYKFSLRGHEVPHHVNYRCFFVLS